MNKLKILFQFITFKVSKFLDLFYNEKFSMFYKNCEDILEVLLIYLNLDKIKFFLQYILYL